MELRHIEPNTVTFGALVDAYARNGQVDAARRTFDRMERSKVERNGIVYNAMASAYAKVGDLCAVRDLIESMKQEQVVSLTCSRINHALFPSNVAPSPQEYMMEDLTVACALRRPCQVD